MLCCCSVYCKFSGLYLRKWPAHTHTQKEAHALYSIIMGVEYSTPATKPNTIHSPINVPIINAIMSSLPLVNSQFSNPRNRIGFSLTRVVDDGADAADED